MKRSNVKIVVDAAMTLALLLLMPYELIGTLPHESIGTVMLLLFVIHHILNRKWTAGIFRGRYTAMRSVQTAVILLMLVCLLGSGVSGVLLSKHLYKALPDVPFSSLSRRVHMLCAYWGFTLMSLHLGFHLRRMVTAAGKHLGAKSRIRTIAVRAMGVCIALYGGFAFVKRGVGDYLFLRTAFAFFDHSEPVILFILDYIAVMGTFVFLGYYLSRVLMKLDRNNTTGRN